MRLVSTDYPGTPREQTKAKILDPSGNAIELKACVNPTRRVRGRVPDRRRTYWESWRDGICSTCSTTRQRSELTRHSRRRRFKRNEVVFHDGDPGDTLHIVMKGHFAVRITTPLGDTATLRVVGPGDHFGELAVLAPAARTGSVVALDRAETLCVTRDASTRCAHGILHSNAAHPSAHPRGPPPRHSPRRCALRTDRPTALEAPP